MQCTAQFINGTPTVFLVPIFGILLLIALLIVMAAIATYVMSIGQIEPNEDLPFLAQVKWSDEVRYAMLYQLFGYLWWNAVIIGCSQFVISAAAAIWYFTSTSDTNGSGSITQGIWWVTRYHFGTICFGAFLIAVVQMIRIIFEYYRDKIEKANKENPVVKCLLWTTTCCLDCLERFVKFISKNAYIQCAITGKNFCASAWNAFILILTNALTFGTAASIGTIFVVLGVLFVGSANAAAVYALLHYVPQYQGLASNWIGPVLIAGLEGVLIGQVFMSVYSFASDTILQCYMVDQELNRGPGMGPATIQDLLDGVQENKDD